MALILSAATGNFNAGATWVGGVVPTVGDEARASTGHTITITANATCTEISNAGSGTFVLNSGVTLTANVTNKTTTANVNCLSFSAVSPATATIVGTVMGGAASNGSPTAGIGAILNSSTGTLIVQGNVVGGSGVICIGAFNSSTGTISVTGNVTGGTGNQCSGTYNSSTGAISISGNVAGGSGATAIGANNAGAGTLTITGNVSGGTISTAIGVNNASTGVVTITSATILGTVAIAVTNAVGGTVNVTGNVTGGTAANIYGVSNAGVGTINVTGNVTGGTVVATSHGLNNASTGICTIVGICTGGAAGATGANNAAGGTITATRAKGNGFGIGSAATAAGFGIASVQSSITKIEELEFGALGMSPVSGPCYLSPLTTNVAIFTKYPGGTGTKTLVDATASAGMPAATDVRSGVSYASGALTGSCAVPAAGSVALGVPVDNTTGTAALTPEAVWTYAARTTTGGTVDILTNAPASVTPNDIWAYNSRTLTSASGPSAVEIRQEMDSNSTKLANLDTPISSRLASASYTAPTTPPTASEIATAVEGSLLNEADGQAVLNAIVGAIGNQNLSEVSLVAAIRSDIERTGGKLDNVPTAAANASAVWGTATKQITGGTVDTLTNSPSVPSAASIASATRTELAVELARVDSAVSSRMAATEATKLDAVKSKTDALNTDRLANVATTAIVGNLIAQANS